MTDPITPPPELVEQWSDIKPMGDAVVQNWVKIATAAARWGADQELEACLEHLFRRGFSDADILCLRATRRPKPPSLREQALKLIETYECPGGVKLTPEQCDTIRRALEALDG